MARDLEQKENVMPADGDYPYGRIKDDTGIEDGTPVNEPVYGDFHQFFARMFAKSKLTYNNLPDNAYSGFQFFEALEEVVTKYKDIVVYNDDAILDDSAYGTLNIMLVNGNKTFTLPAASDVNQFKKLKILKLGTGKLTVVANGSDTFTPVQPVLLSNGGNVEFTSYNEDTHIITQKNIDSEVVTTQTTNGLSITVDTVSGIFAINTEEYWYNYYIKDGICHISFKAFITLSTGAVVAAINIPLPQNIIKQTLSEDYSFKGSASFMSPGGTTNYITLQAFSNGSNSEGQRIVLKRIAEGDTDITWSVQDTTIQGEIQIKLA